jgi:hypothetical protein
MPISVAVTSFNLLPPVLRRTVHDAYDNAMKTLDAREGCDKWLSYKDMRMSIARHIVRQARQGEFDAERLRASALRAVHFNA